MHPHKFLYSKLYHSIYNFYDNIYTIQNTNFYTSEYNLKLINYILNFTIQNIFTVQILYFKLFVTRYKNLCGSRLKL